ncbi:hypothetical protein ACRJ4B_22530 [Streptomyces sp. GTA36]
MSDATRRRLKLLKAGLLMTASVVLRVLHFIAVLLPKSSGNRSSSSSSSLRRGRRVRVTALPPAPVPHPGRRLPLPLLPLSSTGVTHV